MAVASDALESIEAAKGALESLDLKLDAVRGNVAGLKASISSLELEVQALKDQIAAGSAVTPEQLEAIVGGLGELNVKAGALLVEAEEAAV